jgi:Ca2+-binding EF-hand superfamily protein
MRTSLTLSFAAAAALLAAGAAYAQPETPAEARTAPRTETTRTQAEQRSAEVFGRMDANDDGVLDAADREAARRDAFDRIDADKDGTISFAEFEARRGERGEARADRRGHGGERSFGRRGSGMTHGADADADKDGTVTQAEFTTAALARFDRADADKDGTISHQERRDARHHSRHDRRRGPPASDAG